MRSTPSRDSSLLAALIVAAAPLWAGLSGCADVVQAEAMAGARESPESVARAVLDAIERGSERRLERLLVTREEHRRLLWPELPERNTFPFEYVRLLNVHDTREGIEKALREYGGSDLELLRVEFRKEPERYEDFVLHKGARVWVRRASDGRVGYIETLDVLVEWNGRWKPLNYAE